MKCVINRRQVVFRKISDKSTIAYKCQISENFTGSFNNIGPLLVRRIPDLPAVPKDYMGLRVACSIVLEPVLHDKIWRLSGVLKMGLRDVMSKLPVLLDYLFH